jgi:putative endopeptidase
LQLLPVIVKFSFSQLIDMKLKFTNLLLSGAVILAIAAFTADTGKKNAGGPPSKFIDPANMNLSVKPGNDFFEYANGTWIKQNAIPAKETRWGSFNILHQENTDKLLGLLNEVSKATGQPKGSLKQRVGDLYVSGMDSLAIEKRGYAPIKPDLQRITKIADLNGVISELVYERVNGEGSPLFGFGVGQDSKHPNKNIVQFGQGGISLPDRDYYLKDDARTKKIQDAYKQYIVTLFTLTGTGEADAAKNATTIFNIETALAKAQLSRVAMRDPNKTYNKFAVTDFDKSTPHLNWAQLMPLMKTPGQDTVLVAQPDFFKAADALLASTAVADWKVYLQWNILRGSAAALSAPFVKANFEFSSVLTGQKVQTPRNERMSNMVDGSVGELLGQLYVEKYFTRLRSSIWLTW